MNFKPKEIRKGPTGLQIIWSDGKLEHVDFAQLRSLCNCAVCREFRRPPDYRDPRFTQAREISVLEAVGNYALGVTWKDSHRSIFPFERLRGASNEVQGNSPEVGA